METKSFTTYSEFVMAEIEKCEKKEKDSFHEIMKLIAPANQDKAIQLWVIGTNAEYWKGYYRRRQAEQEEKQNS